MREPLIIHHGNCPDGFGAAWWLGRHLGAHEKYAAKYNEPPSWDLLGVEPGNRVPEDDRRDVWIVDFCYDSYLLELIAANSRSLIVLDHHETARGWMEATDRPVLDLNEFTYLAARGGLGDVSYVHEENHSGVGMVAEFLRVWKGAQVPRFLRNIEDRDLWRWKLSDTREVFAAVTSRPYAHGAWDEMWLTPHADLVLEGVAIERFRSQLVADAVGRAEIHRVTAPYDGAMHSGAFLATNCAYAIGSDVAGKLAKRSEDGIGAYFIVRRDSVQWGLRSVPDGPNVAKIAGRWGGGGHAHSAGFTVPR